jgi:signal transduction histidine kinase
MKKIIALFLIFVLSFAIEYTKKEKEFLKNHPVIYFSAMEYWPIDKSGNSIHTNYIKLLNKYGHINIQPIYYKYWADGFEAAKEGKTYGILALSHSKNRERYFFYTPTYNYHPYYLIVRKNSDIKEFKDLKNKTVYIAEKSIIREKLKNADFKIVNSKHPYEDLAKGKIDAILTFYMPPNQYVKNFRTTKVFIDKTGEEHIGISKKYPTLYSIILKIQKEIPYDELEKIKEKYYFNPMPPISIITPKVTLKDLIEPVDVFLIVVSILFLFLLIYYFFTKKYLNLKLKPFLLGIFLIESLILGLIVYEIVMFNYYSKKILDVKSRSFNELFLTDKIEESVIRLDNEFKKLLYFKNSHYLSLFKRKINAGDLLVINKTLKELLTPEYFHPATLSKIANIKLILDKLIQLQKAVLDKKADISIYEANYHYLLSQIQIVRNYIKNENDKEILLIKEKIKYQFTLLIISTIIFILSNLLLFVMIRKKIYSPINYLYDTILKHKKGKKVIKEFFYNDEVGVTIKEFFSLQNQLNDTIKELQYHKRILEDKVKEEVAKRVHQEEMLLKQSRLALMGEMIDAIAHQWKQPLSILKYYIYLLKNKTLNDKEIKQVADTINTQITHMTNTLEEFRSFFNDKKQKTTFCISDTLQKAINLIKDDLIKHQIKITTDINPDFCIEGIPNEFIHLIITIINNAKDEFIKKDIQNRNIIISTKEDKDFYYLII